jgi:chromosome segregation ATPase
MMFGTSSAAAEVLKEAAHTSRHLLRCFPHCISLRPTPSSTPLPLLPAATAGLEAEVAALKAAADAARAAHEDAAAQLEAKRARLRECDAEIKGLEKARTALLKKVQELGVEKKRRESK